MRKENKSYAARHSAGRRLFFALWPDDSVCQELSALVDTLPYVNVGRKIPSENWHVTLVFLGEVNEADIVHIKEAVGEIDTSSFALLFEHLTFNRHGDLWLACREAPLPLANLVNVLKRDLSAQGFRIEKRRYRPHITLMRKLEKMPEQPVLKPITMHCRGFTLVSSTLHPQGSRYRVIAEWPLG